MQYDLFHTSLKDLLSKNIVQYEFSIFFYLLFASCDPRLIPDPDPQHRVISRIRIFQS
jgi:hypothetical protein